MPPPQTIDLALLTARVQKAVTQHSVNAHEFGKNIYDTLQITGVDLEDEDGASVQEGKPPRKKARVVVETTVRKDFLNPVGVLHGAATAYLIDICSSLPLMALSTSDFWSGLGGLSQSMQILYHAPAPEGTKLKIISETLNVGGKIANMRCEIRNAQTNKLIASGFHSKVNVMPKTAETAAKL
ncbi:hypothetical protein NliqN6_2994 [Naganishia liquefaciens]|uniref:Thioesterase domain-containing protein n=1 Tax=Naganishia liquefaciens TaxID=104408 RepID=A0A8H3YFV3_9TREE|nr:hypothetical protein NliqN6_2994 [Naganishia liquefaciens]